MYIKGTTPVVVAFLYITLLQELYLTYKTIFY